MIKTVYTEIPVKDIERALKFYQAVFELAHTEVISDDVRRFATLSSDANGGISLNQTKNFEPGDKGPLVYFEAGEDLTHHLNRVKSAGGKIVEAKTSMGPYGYYATVKDTEGNLLALYSPK